MLTPSAVQNAKPQDKPYKLRDERAMYLLVTPEGGRLWRFDYRRPGTGKRNTLALGAFPDVSLKRAREKRDEARRLLADGIDPGAQRKAGKAAGVERLANSFEIVAREWHEKQCGVWVEDHASRIMLRLVNDVFPWVGARPVNELTAKELLTVVNRIAERGAVESAHRVLQNCGQVMRYAIATDRAERNPVVDLRGALPPVKSENRAAIVEPVAVGALLRAIDAYSGTMVTRCALQLAPLVFTRPGELRAAEWSEINLETAEWSIPAERMKLRLPHLVPLASQAVAILRELQPLTGRGKYVFPGGRSSKRPMSNNAVNGALRRMGYDKDTMTGHGFRAMARTILDEHLHFRPDYIEHQLAHAVRDPNGRAYNRTAHLPERRKMMQGWADYLDALKQSGNVVPMKRKTRATA